MEFWNDIATRKSWEVLKRLNKQLKFIVIGGWGIYLWTKAMKSKDVDILLINWEELMKIKKLYEAKKNDRLKKYEILVGDIDVDIYLPHYSKMIIPCEDLIELSIQKEGFKVLKPEPLLILKLEAMLDRKDSIKGQKDRIDILSLLLSELVDFLECKKLLEKYSILHLKDELEKAVKLAKEEFSYLGISSPREIKKLKDKWISSIK
jgi:hypothetical protein